MLNLHALALPVLHYTKSVLQPHDFIAVPVMHHATHITHLLCGNLPHLYEFAPKSRKNASREFRTACGGA